MALGGKREGAGRKKGFAALEAEKTRMYIARRVVRENKPIIDIAIYQAKKGDRHAREWLYERAFGKAQQSIDLTSDGQSFAPDQDTQKQIDKALAGFMTTHATKGNPRQ